MFGKSLNSMTLFESGGWINRNPNENLFNNSNVCQFSQKIKNNGILIFKSIIYLNKFKIFFIIINLEKFFTNTTKSIISFNNSSRLVYFDFRIL